MTNLLTALYILIIVSKGIRTTRLTSNSIYIVDNQPLQLNCSSDVVPRGQAASFLINGQDRISVRYEPTLSQCLGTPTSGQSPPFVCANTCSCSSDAKSYTWTYVGIMDTVNGTFTCEMLFGEANIETDTILVAKADPPDMEPVIQVLGDLKPLVAGDNIHISCSIIGGNPLANLSWDCPGNVSTQTDNNKAISYLAFEMRAEDDRKTWSCIAAHTVNHFRKSVHYILEVLYFPNITKCAASPNDGRIDEFQTVKLRCEVRGNPLPNISWISSEETILRKDDNISESSLTINKASCIQSGKYRFFAENAICGRTHTDSRYIEVNVNYRPHFDLRRQILSKLIAVEVNKTYAFTSYLVAYPKPAIQWILPSSVHFRNRFTDGFEHESTVFITSAVESPAGEYTMFENNSKGNMLFSFTVVVEGVPTAPYHVFVTCKETIAFVTWQSEFNGGQDETFNVQYWNLNQPDLVLISDTVNDPGLSNISLLEIKELISASQYSFAVVALNKYGDATSRVLDCTTDDGNRNHNESNHYDSIITQIGIPVLSAFVSAILVIIVIYIREKVIMSRKKLTELRNPDGQGALYDTIEDHNRGRYL